MIIGARVLLKQLDQHKVLENAFKMYPHYDLTLTGTENEKQNYMSYMLFKNNCINIINTIISGHSLGAGLAVLLGILIRPRYPDLRVYAFATPGTYFIIC